MFFGALNHSGGESAARRDRRLGICANAWQTNSRISTYAASTFCRMSSPRSAAERIRDIILSGTARDRIADRYREHSRRARRLAQRHDRRSNRTSAAPAARLQRQSGPGSVCNGNRSIASRPAAGEVEIEVECTGLNFRDLMWMLSLLPDDILDDGFSGATLGLECAGSCRARRRRRQELLGRRSGHGLCGIGVFHPRHGFGVACGQAADEYFGRRRRHDTGRVFDRLLFA